MKKKVNSTLHYAVCINNEGYKASLEKGKQYRTIPDEQAASHGYIRVIDETAKIMVTPPHGLSQSSCRAYWKKPFSQVSIVLFIRR